MKFLRQHHAGPAAARNKGATCASGEFLAFTDDDCQPDPHWLTAFAERFVATPEHLIGGRTLNALPGNFYSAASHAIMEVVYEHFNASSAALFFATDGESGSFHGTSDSASSRWIAEWNEQPYLIRRCAECQRRARLL